MNLRDKQVNIYLDHSYFMYLPSISTSSIDPKYFFDVKYVCLKGGTSIIRNYFQAHFQFCRRMQSFIGMRIASKSRFLTALINAKLCSLAWEKKTNVFKINSNSTPTSIGSLDGVGISGFGSGSSYGLHFDLSRFQQIN